MKMCTATTKDGTPCQAAAVTESNYCFFHDPNKEAARREAQAEGGRQNKTRTLDSSAPRTKIHNSKELAVLMSDTIDQVLTGQIDPGVGYAVGYLGNLFLKAQQQSVIEERLDRIVRLLERQDHTPEILLTGGRNGSSIL
jgi:hypothetical protein